MPNVPYKNPILLLNSIKDEISSNTNITTFDRDSKIRVLSDILSDEMLALRQDQIVADYANSITTARDADLEAIGDRLGVPRRKAAQAFSDKSEQNFMFYVDTGTFGDINSGFDIATTAGTTVYSAANANELNKTINFVLTENITLPAASTLAFASVKAVEFGSSNNVGAVTVRNHNFTNYTDAASKSLKVVNTYAVINGWDDEPPDIYRYRLLQNYNKIVQNSVARIQLSGLEVPGVLNSRVESGYFGIGTAAVLVMGPEWTMTSSVLNSVQSKVNEIKSPGIDTIATAATEVKFDFVIYLRPARPLNTVDQSRVTTNINSLFLQYFRSQPIGATVDFSDLLQRIQKRAISTVAFVDIATEDVFRRIYVRKGFSGSTSDERDRVISSSYPLASDEFASLGTLDVNFV